MTHQQPLLDLGAAPLGEATIFTVDGEAVALQHPLGGDVVLDDAGVDWPYRHLSEEERQRPRRDAAAPELLPQPVADLRFAEPGVAGDRAGNLAVHEDDAIGHVLVGQHFGPWDIRDDVPNRRSMGIPMS